MLAIVPIQGLMIPLMLHIWMIFAFMGNFKKSVLIVQNELDLNSPVVHYLSDDLTFENLEEQHQIRRFEEDDFV